MPPLWGDGDPEAFQPLPGRERSNGPEGHGNNEEWDVDDE